MSDIARMTVITESLAGTRGALELKLLIAEAVSGRPLPDHADSLFGILLKP